MQVLLEYDGVQRSVKSEYGGMRSDGLALIQYLGIMAGSSNSANNNIMV